MSGGGGGLERLARRTLERARQPEDTTQEEYTEDPLRRFRGDPVAFMQALHDPETDQPFVTYPEQERFLREVAKVGPDGRMLYPEQVFSAPKKSGKTATAAVVLLYFVRVEGGRWAEGYVLANDYDQAQGRVFQAVTRIIEASPLFRGRTSVTADVIKFTDTGATITALPADYAGAAGAAPTISVFDELWGYKAESSRRLWDEMVPIPTRRVSVRLTVTYAGFEGESVLLEELYKRGMQGEPFPDSPAMRAGPGMLMYWTHDAVAPWQTPEWIEQMRAQLRPSAFTRMIANQFTSGESGFVDMEQWDQCVDENHRPILMNRHLPVWVGLDASTKRDSTALVAVTFDPTTRRVRLVQHKVFQPSPDDPLDFEATIEQTLMEWRQRFSIRAVWFDPLQLIATSQRLSRAGLKMVEFTQTVPNLTESSSNLSDLIRGRNLTVYPDPVMRLAISHAVAVETSRGWRIAKLKTSHKIDLVVALAFAALGAVKENSAPTAARVFHYAI